ncbi:MAG: 5-dehydro-2-deoxygluconokinase [Paracoccaceae bacterium]
MTLAGRLAPLTRNRFLVLGRAGMDLYADPPGTELEQAERFVAHLGGSAANIAAGLSRLGAQAGLIGTVSDDAVGRFCLSQLDRYGIDRRHVGQTAGEARTSLAVVETRSENCQSVIYRNIAADLALSPGDIATIDFSDAGALVVTGTAMASESGRLSVLAALGRARAAGCVTILDVDFRPYSWPSRAAAQDAGLAAAEASDIVVGNDVEFGLLAGEAREGLDCARALVRGGLGLAVHKMGEAGAITVSADGEFRTGIFPTAALKPTGAGDAFLSGLLAALALGRPLRQAVLEGSASAAIVVSRVGCAPAMPTRGELDDFLASHPDPA